jgi:RNA polymerase-binding transcription factor DksA
VKKNKTNNKKPVEVKAGLVFPASLLQPIGHFLSASLANLQKRKKDISKEDPFKDTARLIDNASPDTEAAEQFGHARTTAIEKELKDKITQTKKALRRIKKGKYGICEDCGKLIDTDRLSIYPEATFCVDCTKKREK